jgi:hypothetical protein
MSCGDVLPTPCAAHASSNATPLRPGDGGRRVNSSRFVRTARRAFVGGSLRFAIAGVGSNGSTLSGYAVGTSSRDSALFREVRFLCFPTCPDTHDNKKDTHVASKRAQRSLSVATPRRRSSQPTGQISRANRRWLRLQRAKKDPPVAGLLQTLKPEGDLRGSGCGPEPLLHDGSHR